MIQKLYPIYRICCIKQQKIMELKHLHLVFRYNIKTLYIICGGDVNIESPGNLYFAGEKLEVNVWKYNTDNPADVTGNLAQYIYFATPNDTDSISYSYVGIGTKHQNII